ncbi:conserved hypothetical protein [Xanthomonas campestris pv. campestris str. 8004]|nr:conserved hypothetical protein [Xanthomonas campestris pv. campestris str. 8004]
MFCEHTGTPLAAVSLRALGSAPKRAGMEEHTKQAFVMLRQEATELLALFDRLCCDTAPATPMQGNEVEPVRAHPPQTGDVTL